MVHGCTDSSEIRRAAGAGPASVEQKPIGKNPIGEKPTGIYAHRGSAKAHISV